MPTRSMAAWKAAYHSRPRGRHYDVGLCVDHAALHVKGLTPGHLWFVEPDSAPAWNAWVRVDDRHGAVVVTHVRNGTLGESFTYDREYTIEYVGDLMIGRGLAPVYDWRR